MNKYIWAAGIGSLLEWAEFTFYAYMVLIFAKLFFPHLTHHAAIFAGFSVFAISYLARPVGGVIFGHLGDRYGRKRALSYSIILMGGVTLGMGLLPTYQQLGVTAPILLIILRFLQGLSIAGEFSGAAIFVIEHHPLRPRFHSSWISTFSGAGMLLGSFAAFVVSMPQMPSWAWRVPFMLGFLACLLGLYMRTKLLETVQFTDVVNKKQIIHSPVMALLKTHRAALYKTMALASFISVYVYICNVWWLSYAIEQQFFSAAQAHLFVIVGQACVVIFTPLSGLLADRFPRLPLMRVGFVLSVIVSQLLFMATTKKMPSLVLGTQVAYALAISLVTGSTFYYLSQLFPVKIRYSGQAIGWNIAAALFGGTAPLVAQYLAVSLHWSTGPAFYVTFFSGLALLVV